LDKLLIDILNEALAGCSIADLVENGSCFQERLQELLVAKAGLPLHYLLQY